MHTLSKVGDTAGEVETSITDDMIGAYAAVEDFSPVCNGESCSRAAHGTSGTAAQGRHGELVDADVRAGNVIFVNGIVREVRTDGRGNRVMGEAWLENRDSEKTVVGTASAYVAGGARESQG